MADPGTAAQAPAKIDVPTAEPALTELEPARATPLRFTLSEEELQSIVDRYQASHDSGTDGQLEEILVTAPVQLLPMHDSTQEVWGGLAAPVWALLHPTQAWRIFLPIPEQ